jgi:chemotaxis protein MotB
VSIATDKVLFGSGDATLRPQGRVILDALAPTLRGLPNQLAIDGHTDTNPIHTSRYEDNLALSSDRAVGVLRYLHAVHKIRADRMFFSGYGDTRPVDPGTTPQGLAANRRVEIVVMARLDGSAGRKLAELGTVSTVSASAIPTRAATPT